jgi:hypothetical protein
MMKVLHISVILSTIAIFLRCADFAGPGGEGNGSETIARGVITDSTGAPIAGVPVQLLPAAYDPGAHGTLPVQWRTLTDPRGGYRLDSISAGTYTLEAGSTSAGMKALVNDIEISGRKIEMVVDTGRLQKTGTVIVQLAGMTPHSGDYVYLPGTNTFTVIAAPDSVAGQAVLHGVPAGTYTDLIYVAADDTQKTDLIIDAMTVFPGNTVASAYAAWKYARQLYLNTTVSGADITGNVYNFPLLVRLSDATFDFYQAQSGGEDIRFVKSDGTQLVHEIERWDPVTGLAEMWVRVDTIYGDNSTQTIAMYWGNTAAGNPLNGAGVFDTAAGFQGVWHLGDAPGDSVRDATINRYHGGSPDTARPSIAGGNIGNCRAFDGVADFITMKNSAAGKLDFPQNGKYSVSAWVMAETFNDVQQTLVSKGRFQYFLWIDSTSWQFWEFQDHTGWETSAQQATLRQWVLLTGVRDGAKQYLYLNGESVDSVTLKSNTSARDTESDLNLGCAHELATASKTYANLCFFRGKIDEVQISSVSRSADWIKLCYMNEREDGKLIVTK